tara:strand:- start:2040 stop:2465 length:426 start_codon:yes stop_codon:yes gene_type:complete
MFTLIGSVIGFATSFLPRVMDYFQSKADNAHELRMLEAMAENKREEMALDAEIREVETIYRHDAQIKGGKFIDGLRASVRPVITYLFVALFIFVEVSAYLIMLDQGMSAIAASQMVWSAEINGLFAAIISFWFGGRAFGKK